MSRQRARSPRKNQLRDMLDYFDSGQTLQPAAGADLPLDDATLASELINTHGNDAICFHAGDFERAASLTRIPTLCRFPYDVMWVQFMVADDGERWPLQALCFDDGDDAVVLVVDRCDSAWRLITFCAFYGRDLERGKFHGSQAHAQAIVKGLSGFLTALNCRNVTRVEHPPRPKRQKMRARQGKKPLFSYWTLQLTNTDGRTCPMGGTHASPRVHLRRGHPRQYAPGQWTWVQPHAVGSTARGMVHKDYDGSRLYTT